MDSSPSIAPDEVAAPAEDNADRGRHGETVDHAAMLAQAETDLNAMDRALQRLDDGSYGRCLRCDTPLADSVLEADPLLTTCVPECAP